MRLHQVAEAQRVGVVERRVDLVEQAERRRVELEQREHQRDRGERLLAAREQVDAGVALARRVRHDLHAGVEDLLAGHASAWPRRRRRASGTACRGGRSPCRRSRAGARGSRGRCAGSRPRACVTASSRSVDCESRNVLRSWLVRSSSSAARFTAPSSLIAWVMRVISPCRRRRAGRRLGFGGEQLPRPRPPRCSWVANWSKLSCAACSFSRSSPTLSRSGAARASACSLASSSSRSAPAAASTALRASPSCLLAGDAASQRHFSSDCAHRRDRIGGELLVEPRHLGVARASIC